MIAQRRAIVPSRSHGASGRVGNAPVRYAMFDVVVLARRSPYEIARGTN
jgi:hypothetical protein